MRQGEILGLRWKDIDFDKKILTVRQTLSHYGTELRSGAKTVSGERIISLPDVLIDILKKQRTAYLETKLKLGKEFEDIDIVIFNYRNGKTIFPSNLTKTFKKDIKPSNKKKTDSLNRIGFLPHGLDPKMVLERGWLFQQMFGSLIELACDDDSATFVFTIYNSALKQFDYDSEEIDGLVTKDIMLPIYYTLRLTVLTC